MIAMLMGLLAAMSPWLLGAALALNVTLRVSTKPGAHALGASVGGYLGCLGIALILEAANQYQLSALNSSVLYGVLIVTMAAVMGVLHGAIKRTKVYFPSSEKRRLSLITSALVFLIAGEIMVAFYHHIWVPTQGWDVLHHWAQTAKDFLSHSSDQSLGIFGNDHRHPATVSYISAWSAWAAMQFEGATFSHILWFSNWVTSAILIYGFARHLRLDLNVALFMAYAALNTPLLENHGLIAGYADSLITTALTIGCVFVVVSRKYQCGGLGLLGFGVACTALLLKGTGSFYALLVICPFFFVWLASMGKKPLFFASLCCIILLTTAISYKLDVHIAGQRFSLDISNGISTGYARFSGKVLLFFDPGYLPIVKNQAAAWFLNVSFSILPLAFFLMVFWPHGFRLPEEQLLLAFAIGMGLCAMVLSQYTVYGYTYAIPERDTTLSRFTMPVTALILFFSLTFMDKKYHDAKESYCKIQNKK